MLGTKGEILYKRVQLRFFSFDNKQSVKRMVIAPSGKGFSEDDIEKLLIRAANELEQKFPAHEYGLAPLGPASFNFVCRGLKAA